MPQENYSSQNLKGRSFKGQDLTSADFSQADIRSADFSGAVLKGANFTAARAGLGPVWLAALSASALLAAGLAGLILGYGSTASAVVMTLGTPGNTVLFCFYLIVLLFFFILIFRGLGASLGIFVVVVAAITALIAFAVPGDNPLLAAVVVLSLYGAIIWAGVLIGALAYTFSFGLNKITLPVVAGLFAAVSAYFGLREGVQGIPAASVNSYLLVCAAITVILFALSLYIGLKTTRGDEKYQLIRSLAVNLCSWGGTSFRGADLADADFSQATLNHTDFRGAILTRTCWGQTTGLEQARLEGTYLADPDILKLLMAKSGENENYDYQDLRGVNLKNAKLAGSSFIAANLSDATLQGADLSRAKLVQAQLYGTDLTQACLTGACIQDWAISTTTRFDGIKCDFIYLRLPTRTDPDPWRKPDNRSEIFKEGDFSDFIAPIIKTLDIYRQQNLDPRLLAGTFKTLDLFHYQGLDPAAAVLALKKLAREHPEAGLEVVALEGKGSDKIRLQTSVSRGVDSSALSASYFATYNQVKALPEADIQSLLVGEKDERIQSLEKLLASALQQPKFYVETLKSLGELTVILFVSADPSDQARLRITEEFREIKEKLQLAQLRDQFKLELPQLAARPEDISQALLDMAPEIVHFSGHGESSGLAFENKTGQTQLIPPEALAALFEQFQDQVKCVVLNACYSETQAKAIARHIDYVIGMNQAIGDAAAIAFSVGFYQALGAGRTIAQAYKMGCVQIGLQGIPESLTPVLLKKSLPDSNDVSSG